MLREETGQSGKGGVESWWVRNTGRSTPMLFGSGDGVDLLVGNGRQIERRGRLLTLRPG